ncbi:MAG TPA: hypothetical protein DCY98_01320 [Nitrospinae bacterium]|nr:hypothetical protein [Nitrospinota bacterium]
MYRLTERLTNHSSGWLIAAAEPDRSPFASLREIAAVEQELLFPFAPLRENKEFETDALRALLNCRIMPHGGVSWRQKVNSLFPLNL